MKLYMILIRDSLHMKPIGILPDRSIEWCNSVQSSQTCAHSELVCSMLGTLLKLWSTVVPTCSVPKLLGQEFPAWQLEPSFNSKTGN